MPRKNSCWACNSLQLKVAYGEIPEDTIRTANVFLIDDIFLSGGVPMAPKSQYSAQARYDKENTRLVVLKLNRKTDADILLKLEETGNKQGYIKELVRKDIRGQQGSLSCDLIRYAVQPVAHKYGLDRVSLFGSYARGDATEGSDVDLLVEGGNIHNMKTF